MSPSSTGDTGRGGVGFRPLRAGDDNCAHCHRFVELRSGGVWCADGWLNGTPQHGCAFFTREPGADDT